jgi:hypothetical protein
MPSTSLGAVATRIYNVFENGEWYSVWHPNQNINTIMLMFPDVQYITDREGSIRMKVLVDPVDYADNGITPEQIIAPSRDMGYSPDEMVEVLRHYYRRFVRI